MLKSLHIGRWSYLPPCEDEDADEFQWRESPHEPSVGVRMCDDSDELYDFALSRCDTVAKVGNWLLHLSQKDWWRHGDADDFLQLLHNLHANGVFVLRVDHSTPPRCAAYNCLNDSVEDGFLCEEHSK